MCSIRGWLAHDAFMSLRQLAWRATVATSLFFVGCGSLPIFEEAVTSHTGPAGASSLSIPVPPGVGGADLLVAILGIQSNPNTSGPEGWTVVPGFPGFNGAICQADGGGNACQLTVYYRIADGSETTASFSWGVMRQAAGAVLRFSNVDTNAPIGVARPSRGTSDAPTAPIITTTRDGSRVLRIVVCELDQAAISLRGSLALTDEPSSARLNLMSFPDALTDPTNGCGPPLSACDATVRAVGLAVVKALTEKGFLEEVRRKSALFRQKLEGLVAENPDVFEEVRGFGFMLGLKCKPVNADVVKAAYEELLITVPAADNVIRLLPALTLTEEEIAEAITRLDATAKRVAGDG